MTAAGNPIICELLDREELDALLITSRANLRYLCGFSGSDGVLLVASAETVFLTDGRYRTQAHEEVGADRIICYQTKLQAIKELLETERFQRIGFEAADLSVAMADELRELSKTVRWQPVKDQLRSLRSLKNHDELALLRRAATLNQQGFEQVLPLIRPGISERDLALELEIALKRAGGEVNAFDFIVASGERGALPHGIASAKKIAAGELVTIDFGTRVGGYYSDETVTLAVGAVEGKLRQIFAIVLEAQQLAMDAVRPGQPIAELDAVARDFIVAQGYGDYFNHGLGHGLGLEVHEYPALNSRATDSLKEGMVVTIEPGIYLPGVGGVRIEDTVAVTASGYERLTAIPKEFRQV